MHCEINANEALDEGERRHEEKQNGSRIRLAPTKMQNYPRTGQENYRNGAYYVPKEKGV